MHLTCISIGLSPGKGGELPFPRPPRGEKNQPERALLPGECGWDEERPAAGKGRGKGR